MHKLRVLDLKSYGKFKNKRIIIDEDLTVFYGQNEAGKSTMASALENIIFGFAPANLANHPYAPWSGEAIELSVSIGDNQIHRRMGQTITGHIEKDNQVTKLNNKSVLHHVSRNLFKSVFQLTSEDLMALEGKSWEEVENKVLLNYDSDYLNSPRTVIDDLNQEISNIWRDSNRGKSALKVLESNVKALKKEMRDLRLKEDEFKEQVVEAENLQKQRDQLLDSISKLKRSVDGYEKTLGLRNLLSNMAYLEKQYVNKETFLKLPKDLIMRSENNEKMLQEVNHQIEEVDQALDMIDTSFKEIPKEYESIKGIEMELPSIRRQFNTLNTKNTLLEDKEVRLKTLGGQMDEALAICQLNRSHLNEVKALDLLTLKALVHQRDLAYEGEEKNTKPYLGISLFVLGAFAGGFGIFKQLDYLSLAGVFVAGLGLAFSLSKQRRVNNDTYKMIIQEIDEKLKGLSLNKQVAKGVTISWIEDLSRLKSHTLSYLSLHKDLKQLKGEIEKEESDIREKSICPLDYQIGDWLVAVENWLKIGSVNEQVNHQVQVQKNQLMRDKESYSKKHSEIENERILLDKFFLSLGDSVDEGRGVYSENIDLYHKWHLYKDELDSLDQVEVLLKEVDQFDFSKEDYLIEKDTLLEKENELKLVEIRLAEIDVHVAHALEDVSFKDLMGRLESLEEEKSKLIDRRNQLILQREIIKLADQTYQESNKPEVVKSAGNYLAQMTGGKYTSLYFDEAQKLLVKTKSGLRPLSEAFSKGTKNQMYLAFRLSLMDLLDPERRLPLIMDEAFINFDEERAEKTFELFKNLSKKRQIVFFTCHDFYRDFFYDKMGINVIEI